MDEHVDIHCGQGVFGHIFPFPCVRKDSLSDLEIDGGGFVEGIDFPLRLRILTKYDPPVPTMTQSTARHSASRTVLSSETLLLWRLCTELSG